MPNDKDLKWQKSAEITVLFFIVFITVKIGINEQNMYLNKKSLQCRSNNNNNDKKRL